MNELAHCLLLNLHLVILFFDSSLWRLSWEIRIALWGKGTSVLLSLSWCNGLNKEIALQVHSEEEYVRMRRIVCGVCCYFEAARCQFCLYWIIVGTKQTSDNNVVRCIGRFRRHIIFLQSNIHVAKYQRHFICCLCRNLDREKVQCPGWLAWFRAGKYLGNSDWSQS